MKFRIWENQNILIQDEIPTREEAIEIARRNHILKPDKYHEVYRYTEENKTGWGICQWKPRDCEHQCPRAECSNCTSEHENKMKDLHKKQDEYMAKHGLKWSGEYWVKAEVNI